MFLINAAGQMPTRLFQAPLVNYSPVDNTIGSSGLVFQGSSTTNFGGGYPSNGQNNHWLVGGVTYPEPIQFSPPNTVLSSYAHINQLVTDAGIVPTPLTPYCSGGLNNCDLQAGMPAGVYSVSIPANGTLTLKATKNPFTNGDYVILVSGDATTKVNIDSPISVPSGNTLLLTSQTDIHVDPTVGVSGPTNYTPTIEGFYSSDKNFIVDKDPSVQCPAEDKKLNIQGAIVANAALNGGSFQINRDMCADDTCPVVTVKSRLDFVLNAPKFYLRSTVIQKEVAP